MGNKELLAAIDELVEAKGIKKEELFDALKEALEKAWKKENDPYAEVRVEIDEKKGTIKMFRIKHVVEEVEDDAIEIELEEAKELNKNYEVGDEIVTELDPDELNRLAARHAAQIFRQKLREAEKNVLYELFADRVGEVVSGVVERVEENFILVNLGKGAALMPKSHMIAGEVYVVGQPIRVYVVGVEKTNQGAQIIVSRGAPEFLKRLFEAEVHEIYDGTVEIKAISRDPGQRAKVAVVTHNPAVDPTGACIGSHGMRIQKISSQIMGEKIDVINYYENPIQFIVEALKPAEVYGIKFNEETKEATAVVMDNQLSLAIGKKGQNVRLAAKLTGYKIDVLSVDAANEKGVEFETITSVLAGIAAASKIESFKEESKPVAKKKEQKEEVYVSPNANRDYSSLSSLESAFDTKPVEAKPARRKKVEEEKVEEEKPVAKKEEKEEKKMNYMPVYSQEELDELEEDEEETTNKYDEDVDYESFDEYYDDED